MWASTKHLRFVSRRRQDFDLVLNYIYIQTHTHFVYIYILTHTSVCASPLNSINLLYIMRIQTDTYVHVHTYTGI